MQLVLCRSLLIQTRWFFSLEEAILWIMDSYFSWKQLVSSPDVKWWTGVVWILWCFYQTLILTAPIHCRASIAERLMQKHISTIWWRNKLITSLMACGWVNYQQISIFGWTILLVNIICNTGFLLLLLFLSKQCKTLWKKNVCQAWCK